MRATDLEVAIATLQAQRALLGDAVADAAIGPLRARLEQLRREGDGGEAPPPLPAMQQLRHVTVLFLDVVGSTALSQHLDAEDTSALMDGLLARCTDIVVRNGGQVLQYAGDNLLAAFGAERAREDDAERAVHCGLALLDEGRRLSEEVLARHGRAGCQVRVGLHSGPVLLGGGVDEEGTIRGLTVNVAARMEQTAPPGAMRISHDTWAQVRGVFDVQAEPPLMVKGRDAPMHTYLVQRARPRPFRLPARGIDGMATPLVGREAELQHLGALLDRVAAERQARACTLVGEPGVGKSRLLQELQARLDVHPASWWLLRARAHPQTVLQPYGMLRDLLAWRLQIADSDSGEVARSKLEEGLLPWLGRADGGDANDGNDDAAARAAVHRLGQLIGFDFAASPHVQGCSPVKLRADAFAALRSWWTGLARDGSALALLLEDLHWVDDGSLDFVASLLAEPLPLPLLLVATAREKLLERRPDWGAGAPAHERIVLAPLDDSAGSRLAAALLERLRGDPHHDAVLALLQQRGQGNPFFVEELLRMLRDDGVIVDAPAGLPPPGGRRWQVHGERLAAARLPATLVGVLQARLDALPAAERQALQRASIIGPVFWDAALAALDETAPRSLPALRARSLVHLRNGSAFDGTDEDSFHHHLLQQVAYDTVLKPMRRAGHAAAAAWLADRVGDRSVEYLAVTALHFERAGDEPRAVQYLERAADAAHRVHASEAALAHTARALAMPAAAADVRTHVRLLELRCMAADALGRRDVQREALDTSEALCRRLGDDALLAGTLFSRALLLSRLGDEHGALAVTLEAGAAARRGGAHTLAAHALGQAAWSLYASGRHAEGLRHARDAVAALRELELRPDDTHLAQLLTLAGMIACGVGEFVSAHADLTEALAESRRCGARRAEASALGALAKLAQLAGSMDEAERLYDERHAVAEAIGVVRSVAFAELDRAWMRSEFGHHDGAVAALTRSETIAPLESPAMRVTAALVRARWHAAHGEPGAADAELASALQDAASASDPKTERLVRSTWALARLERGPAEAQAALECIGPVLARSEQVGLAARAAGSAPEHDDELDVVDLWACHRVCAALADPRAPALLERTWRRLQDRGAGLGELASVEDFIDRIPLHRAVSAAWLAAAPPRA